MNSEQEILKWIDGQEDRMIHLVEKWAAINSFSDNTEGLATMLHELEKAFGSLHGTIKQIDLPDRKNPSNSDVQTTLPTGKALHITKRPQAPFRILLGGHMDTVYPPDAHRPIHNTPKRIHGPGVADMKGGLAVLLLALEALEKHPDSGNIGWEVLITPDEEIGSPASKELWRTLAAKCHCALLFEPAFPDGAIVSERRGSANWTLCVKGVAAHVGRDFEQGRNAIIALAQYLLEVNRLNASTESTVNVGFVSGGGPVNIVPDAAMCRINARVKTHAGFEYLDKVLHDYASEASGNGIMLTLKLDNYRAPKRLTHQTQVMLDTLVGCAKVEGFPLEYRPTGGVCDGNTLAEVGLPVVDTLGVIGGELHTPKEYAENESLRLRCRLVTRFLLHIAQDPERFLKRMED